jgi:type II secretion system protein N
MKLKLPNFSMTAGQIPSELAESGGFRRRLRKLRSMAPWLGLGFGFFLLFTWMSLPTRAIAWRIGHEARKAGYVVDIEDITVWPWGTVTLKNVQWTFSPSREDQVPTKFILDDVDVRVGLFSLMIGNLDVEVETVRDEGRIWAHYARNDARTKVELEIEELPLYDVPKARQALNVPLMGLFGLKVSLEVPGGEYSKANGFIEVSCASCRLGDGETKLYVPGSKGLKDGVTIPEIDLGSLSGRIEIEEGKGEIVEIIETESDDLSVAISGAMRLHDKFELSGLDIVIKADFSDALQERSERIRLMVQTASPMVKLEAPERGLGWRLEGVLKKPRFLGINSKTRRETLEARRKAQQTRDARKAKLNAKREAEKRKKAEAAEAKRAAQRDPPDEPRGRDAADDDDQDDDDGDRGRDDSRGDDRDNDAIPPSSLPRLNIEPIEPPAEDDDVDDAPALPPAVSDEGNDGSGDDRAPDGSAFDGGDPGDRDPE